MSGSRRFVLLAAAAFLIARPAAAHPGSGIVADRHGQIYFIDTGAGVWRLNAKHALSLVPGPAFHWMTIDLDNRFAKTKLPSGAAGEITRIGGKTSLIVASDFPIVVGGDGNLYYHSRTRAGGVDVLTTTPTGRTSVFARVPLPYLNGMAAAPDGSIYVTGNDSVRKIDPKGEVSMVVSGLALSGCGTFPGVEPGDGPFLRGLDVDAGGTILVAATGCGRVVKITPDGKATTVLQLDSPWSPTAVVRLGADVYVLEYLLTAAEDRKAWIPRVRKITADGKSAVLATVERR